MAKIPLSPVPLVDVREFPLGFLDWLRQLRNYLDSGVYTPTVAGVSNITSVTALRFQYNRVGTTVTVSGQVTVNPTAGPAATVYSVSLPIPSNFIDDENCAGLAASKTVTGEIAVVFADKANNVAIVSWDVATTASRTMTLIFTYQVI